MTLLTEQLEFYYLNDNNLGSDITWAQYRDGLEWSKWGIRPGNYYGQVGVPSEFQEEYNTGPSTPIYFLKGKYLNLTNISGSNMTKDYIVASDASILIDEHPVYQYTWVAIQNRNTTGDTCIKFGCSSGLNPQNWNNNTEGALNENTNYINVRWMGLIDGSNESALSALLTGTFPHKASIQQRDSGLTLINEYNWWDAFGTAPPVGDDKYIYHGHNNLLKYKLNNDQEFKPWQINYWVGRAAGGGSPPNRYGEHCMDIPAGKTLIGIVTVTKDYNQSQYGNIPLGMNNISSFGWKYAELECTFDYLVID